MRNQGTATPEPIASGAARGRARNSHGVVDATPAAVPETENDRTTSRARRAASHILRPRCERLAHGTQPTERR